MPRIDHRFVDEFGEGIIGQLKGHEADVANGVPKVRGLLAELHELIDRHAVEKPDGHAPSSMGGDGGSGQVQEVDANGRLMVDGGGHPVMGAAVPHSDRTGQAVDARARRGPVEIAIDEGTKALVEAHLKFAHAIAVAMKARPPVNGVAPDDIWCRNHEKHGMYEPRAKRKNPGGTERDLPGGLCESCYSFERDMVAAYGIAIAQPKKLLKDRAAGRRITAKDVEKAVAHLLPKQSRASTT